ncbi:MAG: glycosyltransferase [Paracoccaceae bacterium]
MTGDAVADAGAEPGARPSASVVIPSFNRPDSLRACLDSLLSDPDETFEVVVVDDGGETPLEPVCADFGPRVRCLRQRNAGPAAARNAGARAARADFLAFTDDDCRPRPGWVAALRAAAAGEPGRLIGGRVENGLHGDPYAEASQSLCDYLYEYFGAAGGSAEFFTSNNIGCAVETFHRIGGFDETFPLAAAEDRDFGMRWCAEGGTLVYAPEAVVEHRHAMSLRRFWRQHSNYGRGARHLHGVMTGRGDARPKIEPMRFYIGLVLHPLRGGRLSGVPQAALMALSQVAMVFGYATEALSAGRKRA